MQGVTLNAFGVILYPPVWAVVIITCASWRLRSSAP